MGPYLVGVDIGGTFTDCVVLDAKGRITATKSPSTPGTVTTGRSGAPRRTGAASARREHSLGTAISIAWR